MFAARPPRRIRALVLTGVALSAGSLLLSSCGSAGPGSPASPERLTGQNVSVVTAAVPAAPTRLALSKDGTDGNRR